jgi:flagellin
LIAGTTLLREEIDENLVRINTNVSSLQAIRAVTEHNKQIENSAGKLSSGTRVRSAADDAASLAIGTKQKVEIRSQGAAIRNANDVISELQTAEGGMSEVGNLLTRLRELSVHASNGTLQDEERGMLNAEFMGLRNEIERQVKSTRLRGESLLNSTGQKEFYIGTKNEESSKLVIKKDDLVLNEFNMNLVDSGVSNITDARLNLGYIDEAIQKVSENRARVGAIHSRVESAINNLDTARVNTSASMSQIMDTDFAYETAEKIKGEQKLNAATSVLAQTNQISSNALRLLRDN